MRGATELFELLLGPFLVMPVGSELPLPTARLATRA